MEVKKEQLRAARGSLDLKRKQKEKEEGRGRCRKGQKAFNGPGTNLNHGPASLCWEWERDQSPVRIETFIAKINIII